MKAVSWRRADIGYGRRPVLTGVDLDIPEGGFTLLQGGNGTGKTTLLRSLMEPKLLLAGEIVLAPEYRSRIAYLPQERAVRVELPLTVEDVVFMGMDRKYGFRKWLFRRRDGLVTPILDRLGLLPFRNTLLRECSGGTLKKALLGRVLAGAPKMLLLDEPFAEVDRETADNIRQLLLEENRDRGVAIVVVSHQYWQFDGVPLQVYRVSNGEVRLEMD